MNMKCPLCGTDKFHLDVENQKVTCSSCPFAFEMKALVRGEEDLQPQKAPEAVPAPEVPQIVEPSHDDDFVIVGGVLKAYKGECVDVVVPEGVLEIGVQTFKGMTQIRSVQLPEGLKVIRREAFWGCTNLQRINIPDSVECIEESIITVDSSTYSKSRCFWGCVNLTEIIWRENLDHIYYFEGTAYFENRKEIIFEREKSIIKKGYCPKCGTKIIWLFIESHCFNCGKTWVRRNGSIGWGVSSIDTCCDFNLQGRYSR